MDGQLAGEVNINNVTRGALQGATIGYWIDRERAGQGYIAEAVVVLMRFAFEQLQLHRLEICIVPRNANSRRVVEKLGVRCYGIEGVPQGRWALLDFGDVIVHAFHHDARGYYDLAALWMDAVRVPVVDGAIEKASKGR